MASQRKANVYSNVRQFTEQGHESLRIGDLTNATKHFSHALEKAELYGDEFLIRACSFNLGSCLVAFGQPSRGLVYLSRSLPPKDQSDGLQNFADLQYNIGIAKHATGDVTNAAEAYQKASDAYKELDNTDLQIETLNKLALSYKSLKKPREAAESLTKVAELYKQISENENRAIALSQLTMLLAELKEMEECSKTLSVLLEVCHELDNPKLKGKIYHDIGLLYSSEHCYQSASECFEHSYHALEEVHREDKDRMLEAIVLMNLGASLNHLDLYERGITFHTKAIKKFDQIGDKRSKSQAFCNLAYAYSKTEEYEEAKMAFNDAIQCCKDCDNFVEASLATEGLAAIYFRENDYDNAIKHYKEALAILTRCETVNNAHSERIVNKLAEAVQYQLHVKEGMETVDAGAKGVARNVGRRRRKPKYSTHDSLVAKGLEETNDELETYSSSDYTCSSDETEATSERTGSNNDESHVVREKYSVGPAGENYLKSNKELVNRRRNHSVRSYIEADGQMRMVPDDIVAEANERERKTKDGSNHARNSRTCVIQ